MFGFVSVRRSVFGASLLLLGACSGGGGGGGGGAGGAGGGGGDAGVCTPGALSCPCADGACNDGLTCDRGFCVDPDAPDGGMCAPGASGCACNEGNTCNDGLVCLEDECRTPPPAGDGLVPTDAAVRGCDVLFEEIAGPVAHVRFSEGVTGEFTRRDGKAAVSFVTGGAPNGSAASIELHGGVAAGAQTLRYLKSTCYDGNGRPLQGDGLRWD